MSFTLPSLISSSPCEEEPLRSGKQLIQKRPTLTIPDASHPRPASLFLSVRDQGSMSSSDSATPPLSPSSAHTLPPPASNVSNYKQVIHLSPTEYIYDPALPSCDSSSKPGGQSMIGYFENVLLKPAHKRLISILQKSEANTREFSAALGYVSYPTVENISTPANSPYSSNAAPEPSQSVDPNNVPSQEADPEALPVSHHTLREVTRPQGSLFLSPILLSPSVCRPSMNTRTKESARRRQTLRQGEMDRTEHFAKKFFECAKSDPIHRLNGTSRTSTFEMVTIQGLILSAADRLDLTTAALKQFDETQGETSSVGSSVASQEGTVLEGEDKEITINQTRKRKDPQASRWIMDWIMGVRA